MSTALVPPLLTTDVFRRKRFTRQEVEILLETGIFAGQRWELIDGELLDKMGQNPPHTFAIQLLHDWFVTFLAGLVRVLHPIETSGEDRERSVPEPDISILREKKTEYRKRDPRGDELTLVVEVADSSVAFDLSRKSLLYAKAGVPEYWVLDLPRRVLVVHRQSDGSQFRHIQIYSGEQTVSIEGRTESCRVADLLPEAD
jgi:Uma2 family endonuclease